VSFPAYDAIGKDLGLGFSSWRVFMFLVNEPVLNHVTPVEVKVWFVAEQLHMGRRHVSHALDWLVQRGYLVQHAKDGRGVRTLSLAWAIPDAVRKGA
jgi:hypothetical protein